jgi:hypothetical protein
VQCLHDKVHGVVADIVEQLDGPHRVAGAKLHRNVDVLDGRGECRAAATSGVASPRSTRRTASNRKGTSSLRREGTNRQDLFTMNPGVSLQGTVVFPSELPQSRAACSHTVS